jgi:hypothetical protein
MADTPAWVDVQSRTFVRWINLHLAQRLLKIERLDRDLADGTLLCNLLEILSDKSIGRISKQPRLRLQKIENIHRALAFINEEGLAIRFVAAEDVCDGNIKLVLGVIWTLILRYDLGKFREADQSSVKAVILQWVHDQIKSYELSSSPTSLTSGWNDGTILAALVDAQRPGLFPRSAWPAEPAALLEKAIAIASQELNIPRLIEPADFISHSDELSLLTYLSQFRNAFFSQQSTDTYQEDF